MNSLLEASGWTTAGSSILLQIGTALSVENINPYITAITGVAGFIFFIYKIIDTRIKTKHTKLQNKILENQLKNIDTDVEKPHKLN